MLNFRTKARKWRESKELQKRFAYTLKFVKETWKSGETLDIGDYNEFGERMCEELGVEYRCTVDKDLDYHWFSFSVDNVFCFEVIEHLINPLLFLDTLKCYIKPETRIYLSYPNHVFNWVRLWSIGHFHEMSTDRFKALVDKSGYEIVRHETKWLFLWRSVLSFKLPIKLLTGGIFEDIVKNQLYELRLK